MPKSKHILILANSIKHWPGVCVAGREIRSDGPQYTIGPWIRPVSSHGEGELSPTEVQMTNGRSPRVMEFVEVSLTGRSGDPLQPENWLIDAAARWHNVSGKYQKPSLELLTESPQSLWRQPNQQTDRVTGAYLHHNPPGQSLYLVRIEKLRARFGWKEWDGQYRPRRRALFVYNGVEYDLGITDPAFSERHRAKFPAKGQPTVTFPVASAGDCHLCVSLAPEFNNCHYKVAATIFE